MRASANRPAAAALKTAAITRARFAGSSSEFGAIVDTASCVRTCEAAAPAKARNRVTTSCNWSPRSGAQSVALGMSGSRGRKRRWDRSPGLVVVSREGRFDIFRTSSGTVLARMSWKLANLGVANGEDAVVFVFVGIGSRSEQVLAQFHQQPGAGRLRRAHYDERRLRRR